MYVLRVHFLAAYFNGLKSLNVHKLARLNGKTNTLLQTSKIRYQGTTLTTALANITEVKRV